MQSLAELRKKYKTWKTSRKEASQERCLSEIFQHKELNFYCSNRACDFSRLCDKYGSDKGGVSGSAKAYSWPSHSYSYLYSRLFSHCREGVKRVFECGLGTNNPLLESSMGVNGRPGASLRVWRDYFPNAGIVGGDIDREILISEERIDSYFLDQTDKRSVLAFWEQVSEGAFDLMVDDGLHTFDAGKTLFEHSVDRLSKTGIYIIEDCGYSDLLEYKEWFDGRDFFVEFFLMHRPNLPLGDNSAVVIRKTA